MQRKIKSVIRSSNAPLLRRFFHANFAQPPSPRLFLARTPAPPVSDIRPSPTGPAHATDLACSLPSPPSLPSLPTPPSPPSSPRLRPLNARQPAMLRYQRYYGDSRRSENPFEPNARETIMRSIHKSPHTPHPQKHHVQQVPGAPSRLHAPDDPELVGQIKLQDPTVFFDTHEEKVRVWNLLYRSLRPCTLFIVDGRPSVNAAAKRARLDERKLTVAPLSELRPHDDHRIFLEKLREGVVEVGEEFNRELSRLSVASTSQRKAKERLRGFPMHPVPYQPQAYRYLTNEAEAR